MVQWYTAPCTSTIHTSVPRALSCDRHRDSGKEGTASKSDSTVCFQKRLFYSVNVTRNTWGLVSDVSTFKGDMLEDKHTDPDTHINTLSV